MTPELARPARRRGLWILAAIMLAALGLGAARVGADTALGRIIDLDFDIVIGLHLPIGMAWSTACRTLFIGRWQFLVQLAELIAAVALRVLCGCHQRK